MDLADRIQDYHSAAPPCGHRRGDEQTFVLVPDSESGKAFAGLVKRAVPTALTIPVNGTATDLMFCREHGCLRLDELVALLSSRASRRTTSRWPVRRPPRTRAST